MTTTNRTDDEIRDAVSAAYGARAREVAAGQATSCCGDSPAAGVAARFYTGEETDALPETVVSYGCGNPTAIAGLRAGETVLDLGSGAGMDCFLSARQVGPTGYVIGLDMTDDMLALAETNKAKLDLTNVEFKKGILEAMPLPDAAVDVIISNCVINLSPDKDAVFREAYRVLRPGGRVHVSDIVLTGDLTADQQHDLDLWAGCAAGALLVDDYKARLADAGFADIGIQLQGAPAGADRPWQSALINARRPGGADAGKPWLLTNERIELIAPAGLETAACCSTDGSCC
jgi:2-polyprenyl-3-methyl-5-hydroxy-6-metoxy-1,4-benzoquinol methylase